MFMVHARDHTVDEGLKYTALWHGAMFQTEDIPVRFFLAIPSSALLLTGMCTDLPCSQTAIMAGMQKQKPTFSKL